MHRVPRHAWVHGDSVRRGVGRSHPFAYAWKLVICRQLWQQQAAQPLAQRSLFAETQGACGMFRQLARKECRGLASRVRTGPQGCISVHKSVHKATHSRSRRLHVTLYNSFCAPPTTLVALQRRM
jgi:hypothetical protein